MEMRMLRWTQGLTGIDRVRNDDVRSMFGVAPIVAKMRKTRLRWYGHVFRSNDNSVAKSAMNITVEGRRPRGRPKTPWLDKDRGRYAFTEAHRRRSFQSKENGATIRGMPTPALGNTASKRKKLYRA
ncbi:hypothetical protein Y032_0666g1335 [Ancylostoma ceylanicum]|uniref:Reverse transcriptase domain-containing protein n=1 Tax=Ancylostoma ceylanicum TaxID=53326 RepID=A0A016WIY4_9BILA|nr:hypothetical protein Y032_0666g1335 [Ancylostoma ceylanicum]